MYSVFVILVLVACNIEKDVLFIFSKESQFLAAMYIPSPNPSISKAPISVDEHSCKSSDDKSSYVFFMNLWISTDFYYIFDGFQFFRSPIGASGPL